DVVGKPGDLVGGDIVFGVDGGLAQEGGHVAIEIEDGGIGNQRPDPRLVGGGADRKIAAEADPEESEPAGSDFRAAEHVIDNGAYRGLIIGPESKAGVESKGAGLPGPSKSRAL